MKAIFVLFLSGVLFFWSCTKKRDVQCICQGDGKVNSYDLGIQYKPDPKTYASKCDTLGAHDGLDTCNLIIE